MKPMINQSHNLLKSVMHMALDGLRQWSDPAYEGSPFDADVEYKTAVSKSKNVFLRRKALIRM